MSGTFLNLKEWKKVPDTFSRPKNENEVRQLEDFANLARERNEPFNLIIGPDTKSISASVADFVRETKGSVFEFNADNGTFTQIDIGNTPEVGWKRE